MDASQADVNPYESPKTRTLPERGHVTRWLDIWFTAFPILAVAFYAHWLFFLAYRGVPRFSPQLPEGHPGHVSWTVFWWLFAELFALGIAWFSSAALICIMVRRKPSVGWKRVWCWCAILLAPVACPLCYFTNLRNASTAGRGVLRPRRDEEHR